MGDFAYSENMYVDPEGSGDTLESFPGCRRLYGFGKRINGIFALGGCIFVHAGDGLYRFCEEERDSIHALTPIYTLADQESFNLVIGGRAYLCSGTQLLLIERDKEIKQISVDDKITACTTLAFLNNRLYLSGNPDCPELIFRIDEGGEIDPVAYECQWAVSSLLRVGDELYAFTDGGIYAYSPDFSTVRQILSGISIKSNALFALNRLVFLTDCGLMSERGEILSEKLSSKLLPLLKDARISVWRGYITLLCRGKILLCKITDHHNPTWYSVLGIGAYKGDSRLYRYSTHARDGFAVHKEPDTVATDTVMSLMDRDGNMIYYTEDEGVRYEVYPTSERVGGVFFPATHYLVSQNLLYFGAGTGDICIFNNDLRGVAPTYISESEKFNAEEYAKAMSEVIHPDFYSFLGHRVRYLLMTESDDLAEPGKRKLNTPHTLTVKFKSYPRSCFDVEVMSDGGKNREDFHIDGSVVEFYDLNFSSFCPVNTETVTVSLPEKNGVFTEKQICIKGEKHACPIGIISLEYGYRIRR